MVIDVILDRKQSLQENLSIRLACEDEDQEGDIVKFF